MAETREVTVQPSRDGEVVLRVVFGGGPHADRVGTPATPEIVPKLLVDVDEAAERLSLSVRAVYRLMKNGTLAFVRIGNRRRIAVAALEAYVTAISASGGGAVGHEQ